MAYLPRRHDDLDEQTPAYSSGRAPGASRVAAPVATAAPAAAGTSSGGGIGPSGFVNFSAYLNANKDAAKRTSNQVAGKLGKAAQGAKAGLGSVYGQFATQMGAGSAMPPVAGTSIYSEGGTTANANGTNTGRQGMQGTAQRNNEGQAPQVSIDEARARAGATYTGPADMTETEGYAKLRKDTEDAQDAIAATDSTYGLGGDSGLEALLREEYGRGGNYTQGQSQFDAALSGTTGRKQFADLRRQYADLSGDLERSTADTALMAGGARAGSDAAAKTYAQLVEGYDAEQEAKAEALRKSIAGADAAGSRTDKARDWADYSKFDPFRGVYQAKRVLSPQDWIADLAGVKNPEDKFAQEKFAPGQTDYSAMVDFGATLPPGMNSAEWQERVYNALTQAELDQLGTMSRRAQQEWLFGFMQRNGWV